uniref:Uncharacterized protein n=1 Tax=Anguilla anguilla TaxID=7936 RepID=A0A0E9X5F5_ANGAN
MSSELSISEVHKYSFRNCHGFNSNIIFFVIFCEKRFKNMSFLVYYSKMKDCCPLSDISELSTIYVCLL